MLRCAGVGSEKAIEANNRANAKFAADAALNGPNDSPVNILGGHRWSNNVTIVTLAKIIETEIGGDRFYGRAKRGQS